MMGAWLVALVAATQAPPGFWERDPLLGKLGGVRPASAEHGISTPIAFLLLSPVHDCIPCNLAGAALLPMLCERRHP
jgi:hypothetical protein